MAAKQVLAAVLMLTFLAIPASAQITVLDRAQDGGSEPAARAPETAVPQAQAPCGSQPFSIAEMSWPSASLLAHIHQKILTAEYGCEVRLTPGDLAATASSMGSTGQPAAAPELWVNRIADVWNGAMDAQMVRIAAPSFTGGALEGWFMPDYMGPAPAIAELVSALPGLQPDGTKVRLISCPTDWACSVINRNLVSAYELGDRIEIVEPANRLEMDRLIAEAVNLREPFLLYYWQPNAILAQLDFAPIDMGTFDEAAAKCLGDLDCASPRPSAFADDLVVIALAERVFTEMPMVAGYFQRATMPLEEMNALLAQLSADGANEDMVAERFVAERRDVWQGWVGSGLQ